LHAAFILKQWPSRFQPRLRLAIVHPPATAKGAYPITGITFIPIPRDNHRTDHEQVDLKNYINYTLTNGQGAAGEPSHAKFPDLSKRQPRDFSRS
jgi:hypothetical protein